MGLERRKTEHGPDGPEFVAGVLLVAVVVFAGLWWRSNARGDWGEAPGCVVQCDVRPTHYNAPDYSPKVNVTYEYTVAGGVFLGQWSGYWPETNSPNAAPASQVNSSAMQDRPLTVFYNPRNPAESRIDFNPGDEPSAFCAGLATAAFLAAVVYCFRIYPAWKRLMG